MAGGAAAVNALLRLMLIAGLAMGACGAELPTSNVQLSTSKEEAAAAAAEIPLEQIEATVRHLQAIVHAQTGELAEEKSAHLAAEARLAEMQSAVNALTLDRNLQATAKDVALDRVDALGLAVAARDKHIVTLKRLVCGAGALLAMALCLMLGLARTGWAGIAAAFVGIPGAVYFGLQLIL